VACPGYAGEDLGFLDKFLELAAEDVVHFRLASGRAGEEDCCSGGRFRYSCMERAGSRAGSPGCSIKLRPRPGRESHCGIVLDPAQSELSDAPVQGEASELRFDRIR
jgi:hypothetical protein